LLISRLVYNVIGGSAVPSRFSTADAYAYTFSWHVPDAVVFSELQQGELGCIASRSSLCNARISSERARESLALLRGPGVYVSVIAVQRAIVCEILLIHIAA